MEALGESCIPTTSIALISPCDLLDCFAGRRSALFRAKDKGIFFFSFQMKQFCGFVWRAGATCSLLYTLGLA